MIHKYVITAPRFILAKLSFFLSRHLAAKGKKFVLFNNHNEDACLSLFPESSISQYELEAVIAEIIGMEALEECVVKCIPTCLDAYQLKLQ